MKFVDEYRDPEQAKKYVELIRKRATRPYTLMEVCGGQTHTIVKFGLDEILPPSITLVHGPGCPVCVTPVDKIDYAIAVARLPMVTFCSFGDMLRVPGSRSDLFRAKSEGADVRIVYSPLDALKLAIANPERQIVFFAVGFETTAPASAYAVYQARQLGVRNFSLLVAQVLVPPAIRLLLEHGSKINGFLAAGHVCTVTGYEEYPELSRKYRVPIVVTGFEPLDLLQGILMCVDQLESGHFEVENQYSRSASLHGNREARRTLEEVFHARRMNWRGLGAIEQSGLALNAEYADFDAERIFDIALGPGVEPQGCISGDILRGEKKPHECPLFGTLCTPDRPVGAPMVSSEGACAAYYRYRPLTLIGRSAE